MPPIGVPARTGNYGPEVDEIVEIFDATVTVPAIVATHVGSVTLTLPGARVGMFAVFAPAAFSGDPPVAVVVPDGLVPAYARVTADDTVVLTWLATITQGAPQDIPVIVQLALERNVI